MLINDCQGMNATVRQEVDFGRYRKQPLLSFTYLLLEQLPQDLRQFVVCPSSTSRDINRT